jgi:hypothetical protein
MIEKTKQNRKTTRVKPIPSLRISLVIGTVLGISVVMESIGVASVFAQELTS